MPAEGRHAAAAGGHREAVGQASGDAPPQSMLLPTRRTRLAGGAAGRKPGPRACPRPRGLGQWGHSPAPEATQPGKGTTGRRHRRLPVRKSAAHRACMASTEGACDASGRLWSPCPAAQQHKGAVFRSWEGPSPSACGPASSGGKHAIDHGTGVQRQCRHVRGRYRSKSTWVLNNLETSI